MVLSLKVNRGRSRRQMMDALAHALVRDIDLITGLGNVVVGLSASRAGVLVGDRRASLRRGEVRRWWRRCRRRDASCSRCPTSASGAWWRCCATTSRRPLRRGAELRELILHDIQTGTDHLDVLRGHLRLAGNKSRC